MPSADTSRNCNVLHDHVTKSTRRRRHVSSRDEPVTSLDPQSPLLFDCSVNTSTQQTTRYKTELCRSFQETGGVCRYGDKCQFAHGLEDLRSVDRHPRYKTELCRTFHSRGFCAYGPRCHFIHNTDDLNNQSPVNVRTDQCVMEPNQLRLMLLVQQRLLLLSRGQQPDVDESSFNQPLSTTSNTHTSNSSSSTSVRRPSAPALGAASSYRCHSAADRQIDWLSEFRSRSTSLSATATAASPFVWSRDLGSASGSGSSLSSLSPLQSVSQSSGSAAAGRRSTVPCLRLDQSSRSSCSVPLYNSDWSVYVGDDSAPKCDIDSNNCAFEAW